MKINHKDTNDTKFKNYEFSYGDLKDFIVCGLSVFVVKFIILGVLRMYCNNLIYSPREVTKYGR
jgi:hypothetical protein